MNDFDQAVLDMDAQLLDEYSERAIYNNSIIVDIVIDQNVTRQLESGEVVTNAYELTSFASQIEKMTIGDTFEIGLKKYTISNITSGDHSISTGAAYLG